jgi:phosphotransferase system  glucose/maltose/N-acetylglucosamine-specific IIC component
MIFQEVNLDGVVIVILLIMLLPSFVLGLIGTILYFNEKKRAAKILFIIAIVYAIISLGICGSMMMLN